MKCGRAITTTPRVRARRDDEAQNENSADRELDARDRRQRCPQLRGKACARRVYALTYSLHVKSKKPSRGAPPACGPAAATRWTPGEGRGRRKRAPPAKTGSDEPRCTKASHNARNASAAAPSGRELL